MTPSEKPDPGYLVYKKYTELKNEFSKYLNPRDTPSYWKESFEHVKSISKGNLPYGEQIFKDLINYFSPYNPFNFHKTSECCSYINFWLNNEIRKKHDWVPSSLFYLFKEFAHEYSKHKYGHYRYSCKPYLNYLDSDIHKKVTLLYDLYRMYDEIKSPPNVSQFKACDTLSTIRTLYNEVIEGYFEHDPDLFDKLNDFKGLITKLDLSSISDCKWNLSQFKAPDEVLKLKEQQSKMNAEKLTEKTSSPELPTEALDRANNQLSPKVTESPSNPKESLRAEKHEEYDKDRTEIDSINEISPQFEPPRGGSVYLRPQLQPQREENLQRQELSNEPARDSSTILGSITGFINEVEPAPILGVSGGMGALFLLFKYTPVGTFFRGGRRINNRIPRTFYGQFAGGPAGYDDFYEGGFGPGPINIAYRPELE